MQELNLSRWAVQHPAFVLFLIIASGISGIYAYMQLGRAEDPSFTIKTMVVAAQWPGSTATQMQRQVADPIEEKLQELPSLDKIETYCLPGQMFTLVWLKDTTDPKAVPDIWYQARKKIGDIRHTLPVGVLGPQFDDEYGDVYSAIYAFVGADYTAAELKHLAEAARQQLLRVPNVAKVNLLGTQSEKVFVEFSHHKLAALGITPQTLFDSLRRQNLMVPAGSVETPTDRVYIRVAGAINAVEQVAEVPVEANGRILRIGDVATVRRGYEDPPTYTMSYNGAPAIGLGVVMKDRGNVLQLGEDLEHAIQQLEANLPVGVEVHTVSFQPEVVNESVGEFLKSFFEALVIVLAVSFFSLGFRTGIVVALSVPLVLAVVLVVMQIMGMDLDRISLGALILALGLLVDDAIIAVEMMVVKMEEGWDRIAAATFAWTSTAFPMLSGTLITVAGFLPIGFAKSSAGEYAGGIFWVVGIALIVSWFVAVIFTPYLGVRLLPDFKRDHDDTTAKAYQSWSYRSFRWLIQWCVRHPRFVVCTTLACFVAAMFGFTKLQQQFFPQSSRLELMVELRLPAGSSFTATATEVQKLAAILQDDPSIEHFTAYTGAGAPRFFLAANPDLPNPSFAKFLILTKNTEARERLREQLLERFASDVEFALPRCRVLRLDFGPPVGFPVQFRVIGPDPTKVRALAYEVRDLMRQHPATRDTQLEWDEPSKMVRLEVDQDRARAMGLTPAEINETLQTLLSGTTISQYREGTELIDVVARAIPEERLQLEALPDLNIITHTGRAIPVSQVAKVVYGQEEPILWRRNRDTVLTVRADIVDGVQAPDVSMQLLPQLQPLLDRLPPDYRIEPGGAVEESEKANRALFAVFPLMLLVMWTLLMAQVQSFRKAALVFIISPLGLIGAVTFLHLFNAPFGFVALLGVIALAGMDMRNSVILIDQIIANREMGMNDWEAVIEATVRRARPVVLTAATAILAMVPLSRSVFWGPMAIAIMGGLSVATFLTLLNLPALYVLWFGIKAPTSRSTLKPASQPTKPEHANLPTPIPVTLPVRPHQDSKAQTGQEPKPPVPL